MPTYTVSLERIQTTTVDVEARDEAEAKYLARVSALFAGPARRVGARMPEGMYVDDCQWDTEGAFVVDIEENDEEDEEENEDDQ